MESVDTAMNYLLHQTKVNIVVEIKYSIQLLILQDKLRLYGIRYEVFTALYFNS